MRTVKTPLISVLMSTYNCRNYLQESVNCVLSQTVGDFELIIVDDGSTDGSESLLNELKRRDNRIKVFRQDNRGVGAALNVSLKVAQGQFLARLDADDLSPPARFAEQIRFLEDNPSISVVGGWYNTFGTVAESVVQLPTEPEHVKAALLFRNPIAHSAVMMRRQSFQDYGWQYNERRRYPEDYDLWVTIAEHGELANLPSVQLNYRIWPGSVCQELTARWRPESMEIQSRLLARMKVEMSLQQKLIHAALAFDELAAEASFIADAHDWLVQIQRRNQSSQTLPVAGLNRVLTGRYIALYRTAARAGIPIADLDQSPFRQYVQVPLA